MMLAMMMMMMMICLTRNITVVRKSSQKSRISSAFPQNLEKIGQHLLPQSQCTSVTYSLSAHSVVGLLGGFPRCFANAKTSVDLSYT